MQFLADFGSIRSMRTGALIILLGLTALVSYSLGQQDAPTGKSASAAAAPEPIPSFSRPVALAAVPSEVATSPAPAKPDTERPGSQQPAKLNKPEKPTAPDAKRKAEVALTAAAIVAILIKASRDQYYATGHPCACPDDLMRNGRACGARSAHSRPGGASPLCYPSDVTTEMIDAYRRQAARAVQ